MVMSLSAEYSCLSYAKLHKSASFINNENNMKLNNSHTQIPIRILSARGRGFMLMR